MVRPPTEPRKIVNIGLNKKLWPGSAESHLKHIDHDPRGCYRKEQKGPDRRQRLHRQGESPQTRESAAPVDRRKGKRKCDEVAGGQTEPSYDLEHRAQVGIASMRR